jgi:hypothetical protein
MADIRAVDLPELRAELVNFMLQHGPRVFATYIERDMFPVRPDLPRGEAGAYLSQAEAHRLCGDLFFVSSPMTELAKAAGRSLPGFNLMPEDVPTQRGLIVFESPMAIVEEDGDPVHLIAAAWSRWNGAPKAWRHGGLWISWYSDRDNPERPGPKPPTRLIYDNEIQAPFHPDPIPIHDSATGELVAPGEISYPIDVLKSAWLLMQQPLAHIEEVTPDRPSRKRLRRLGHEPSAVRVVHLRRASRPSGVGESDREYHHQWIVRGHWRQQWYPSRQVHRPVWIAPHVKGPEGAPLIGGEKVHAWVR